MSGFTKGPWEIVTGDSVIHVTGHGSPICATDSKRYYERFDATDEANALLIAAAPDLLEAVIQYRDDLKRPPTGDSIERRLAMVNAAIAKATGAAS